MIAATATLVCQTATLAWPTAMLAGPTATLASPTATLACSSCFFGEEGVRYAYYVSAVVMFFLPLLMVAGSARFLRRAGTPAKRAALPIPSTRRRRPLLFASMGSGALMLLVPWLDAHEPPPGAALPVLASLGSFELVDHEGTPCTAERLHGRAWVADFVFTRCPTACPKLTRRMAEFQERTRHLADTRLLSFTIDPEHDTPEVLARYARRFHAGPRWRFVTGPLDSVKRAVKEGLKVRMGDVRKGVDLASVLHGTRFVLVDRSARIRGYYDVSNQATFDKLVRDFATLAAH